MQVRAGFFGHVHVDEAAIVRSCTPATAPNGSAPIQWRITPATAPNGSAPIQWRITRAVKWCSGGNLDVGDVFGEVIVLLIASLIASLIALLIASTSTSEMCLAR